MSYLQEQPSFDKKQFVAWAKKYIKKLTDKLEGEQQEEFKKNIEGAIKFLLPKLKDLQLYVSFFFFFFSWSFFLLCPFTSYYVN